MQDQPQKGNQVNADVENLSGVCVAVAPALDSVVPGYAVKRASPTSMSAVAKALERVSKGKKRKAAEGDTKEGEEEEENDDEKDSTPFIVVLDTETTGMSVHDEVIQLGFIVFNKTGREIWAYDRIWKTGRRSNPFARRVHGISDAVVAASKHTPSEELEHFAGILKQVQEAGGVLVAHNMKFDGRLLSQTAKKAGVKLKSGVKTFCTMHAAKHLSKRQRGNTYKNGDMYDFLGGPATTTGRRHTALADAEMTAYIFNAGLDQGWWTLH